MNVIEHYGHSMARRFGKANISRYHCFEHLAAEEASQVGSHLFRKRSAVIVHRQQNALDGEGGIDRASESHKRVE